MKLLVISVLLFLGSCATYIPIVSVFDSNEVAWSIGKGNNTIAGQGFLRTRGGDIKTCAGFPVDLYPVSKYGTERMKALYGSEEAGMGRNVELPKADSSYLGTKRSVSCDARGDFRFTDLPDGNYFVVTTVKWEIPMGYVMQMQGGAIMKRVSVRLGEAKEVQLTSL